MNLTVEEESILNGGRGPTLQKMMEILVGLGEIYGAGGLIPVKSAQISGVSYKTIGDAGLEWIGDLDGKAVIPAVLNPMGMDRDAWEAMGIDPEFADKQAKIIREYERLGIRAECTCTPYYLERPRPGDHLAWAESSAVCYANSVLGARTNREGGPSALAAALVGKTADYGLHIPENRRPTVTVKVGVPLRGAEYGALGYAAGPLIGGGIPYFLLESTPTEDELKHLGAALASSGAVALFHVPGVTPERHDPPPGRIEIDAGTIRAVFADRGEPDLIALGCPHASRGELLEILAALRGRRVKKEVWVCTGRSVGEENRPVVDELRRHGVRVLYDTCMVVSPAASHFRRMLVNSGKALKYTPSMCGVDAAIASTEECIEEACR